MDINVTGVWERNITGQGVTVVVVDDGVEHTHQDIHLNYVSHNRDNNSTDLSFGCLVSWAWLNSFGRIRGPIISMGVLNVVLYQLCQWVL